MNAATKPIKFPKAAWIGRWTVPEGGQHPKTAPWSSFNSRPLPGLAPMTFVETTVVFSAC